MAIEKRESAGRHPLNLGVPAVTGRVSLFCEANQHSDRKADLTEFGNLFGKEPSISCAFDEIADGVSQSGMGRVA